MELIPACRKYRRLESKMNDTTKHLTWSLQKVNVMKNKRGGRGLGLVTGYERHRKQSKWESFGEEEGAQGKLRKPHLQWREPLLSQQQKKAKPPLRLKTHLGKDLRRKQKVCSDH